MTTTTHTRIIKVEVHGFLDSIVTFYKREDGTWDGFVKVGHDYDGRHELQLRDGDHMKSHIRFFKSKGYKVFLTTAS